MSVYCCQPCHMYCVTLDCIVGICCDWGDGSYELHVDGALVHLGGKFGGSDKVSFGSCESSSPTSSPTSSTIVNDAADLTFLPCATASCGETFATLTRQEVIDLVDRVVGPALGVANHPDCEGDCCNDEGLISYCYGNAACGDSTTWEIFTDCPWWPGVDENGCCSNYAASGIRSEVRQIIQYGIQARKICASCDDFMFEDNSCYDDFCGADVYGHSAMHSGLLILPVDDNGTPISGIHHGSIWYHGTTASTCSVPSEEFSRFLEGSFSANVLSTILFAGHGTIAVAPDGLGYGESYDHIKGYLVKKTYQASAAVLWSKARQVLQDDALDIELGCSGMTSGYSEGGYGAAAGATGLSCIGVDVKRIQMGGAPFQLSRAQSLLLHKNAQKELFPSSRAFYLALFGAPYSTITSNAVGSNPQKLLAENYTYNGSEYSIDEVLSLTRQGNSSDQMNAFLPQYDGIADNGVDFILAANPTYVAFLDAAIALEEDDPCSNAALVSQYGLAKLCSALKENDLSSFVEALEDGTAQGFEDTSWATCHSPGDFIDDPNTADALVYVQNIPSAIIDNPIYGVDLEEVYLGCTLGINCPKDVLDDFPAAKYIKTAALSHENAGARCVRAFANYLNTAEFLCSDPAMPQSSTCQSSTPPTCSDDSLNAGERCSEDADCICAAGGALCGDGTCRKRTSPTPSTSFTHSPTSAPTSCGAPNLCELFWKNFCLMMWDLDPNVCLIRCLDDRGCDFESASLTCYDFGRFTAGPGNKCGTVTQGGDQCKSECCSAQKDDCLDACWWDLDPNGCLIRCLDDRGCDFESTGLTCNDFGTFSAGPGNKCGTVTQGGQQCKSPCCDQQDSYCYNACWWNWWDNIGCDWQCMYDRG
ncbi:hypothetical protein ACHAWF_010695, partial [Thalassiosira exigua]